MDIEQLKSKGIVIGVVLGVIVILLLALNPFVVIGPGERGVLLNFGEVQKNLLPSGLHFIWPVKEKVQLMNIRILKYTVTINGATSKQQSVGARITLNYRIDPKMVNEVFEKIGDNQKVLTKIVVPTVKNRVKSIIAKKEAKQLLDQRLEISLNIKNELTTLLSKYYIITNAFNIEDYIFPKSYQEAIDAKQVAEQQAQREELKTKRQREIAKQKVIKATAVRDELQLKRQHLTPQLIKLKQVEATMKAIDKWDGKLPNVTGGAMPFVDVKSYDK